MIDTRPLARRLPVTIKNIICLTVVCAGLFAGAFSYAAGLEADLKMGVTLFEKEAYALAAEHFSRLLINAQQDDKGLIYFYLAECHKNMGNLEKAGEYYQLALASGVPEYSEKALFELGYVAYQNGRYEQAVDLFTQLIRKYQHSKLYYYARYWIAESYYGLGQFEKAKQHFSEIVATAPDFEYADYARYSMARIYLAQKDYVQAKALLAKVLEARPRELYPSAQYFLARACFETDDRERAEQLLNSYLTHASQGKYAEEAHLMLGEMYYADKDYSRAIEQYAFLLPESPYLQQAYLGLAWSFYQQGQYDRALQEFDRVANTAEDVAVRQKALYQKAYIFNKQQRYDESSALVEPLLQSAGGDDLHEQVYYLHVSNMFQTGQWDEVAKATGTYLSQYPQGMYLEVINLYRGIGLFKQGIYDKALECLKKVSQEVYRNQALYFMAEIHFAQEDYGQANRLYRYLGEQRLPEYYQIRTLYGLAWSSFKLKDFSQSGQLFNAFIERYPDNELAEQAHFLKAESSLNIHSYDTAVGTFEEFIKSYPMSELRQKAVFYQGYALYKTEDFTGAIRYFQKINTPEAARELWEKARYWEGSAFFRLKQWNDAVNVFAGLLAKEPAAISPSELYLKIGDALYNSGDYDRAITYYREGAFRYPADFWTKNLHFGAILCLYKQEKYTEVRQEIEKFKQKYQDKYLVDNILQQIKGKESK